MMDQDENQDHSMPSWEKVGVRKPYPKELTVPYCAYWYARDYLRGPFPEGEKAISQDSYFAYWYARNVLKGPWTGPFKEKAEKSIRPKGLSCNYQYQEDY